MIASLCTKQYNLRQEKEVNPRIPDFKITKV